MPKFAASDEIKIKIEGRKSSYGIKNKIEQIIKLQCSQYTVNSEP